MDRIAKVQSLATWRVPGRRESICAKAQRSFISIGWKLDEKKGTKYEPLSLSGAQQP